MGPRATLRKPAILGRRLYSLVIRAVVITTMSFAVAFGFLSGATSPSAHYDPHMFAIGVSSLFGAACGAIGILISRIRQMKAELRALEARLDEAADRNWEIREAQERTTSFFEAQDDVIVRRNSLGAITYANDAFCALAGRDREAILTTNFTLAVLEQGQTSILADGTRAHDQKIAAADSHAGSPGVKSTFAPTAAARCKASAATSPTASTRSASSAKRAIRRRQPIAPSRVFWLWCPMRSAHR